MANEPLRPGGPPGTSGVLERFFHVPERPSIGRAEAIRRSVQALREGGVPFEQLFMSDQPLRRGALFDASGARVVFPEDAAYERCFVALADPDPGARWAHPASWVFVSAGGEAGAVLVATNLPEHPGSAVRFLPVKLS